MITHKQLSLADIFTDIPLFLISMPLLAGP